ncbi:MAG: sulfatase-like hydrolase/transferase [Acidimicrobiia bacterium]
MRRSRLGRRPLMLLLAATLMAGLLPVLSEARPSGAATPASGQGVWLVAQDGGIFSHGEAAFFGSTGSVKLNQPVVGMAGTPSMKGYWMVATDGGIFSFGDAGFYGSTGSVKLNKPIVGMASTPSGKGYWLVATDGGIFAFGDAGFHGSLGSVKLNKPIVGMTSTPSGKGYWMVASDGGIFSFGDAGFYGATGDVALVQPIVGMASTATSKGYWLVASDGGLFSFGDARFFGSSAGTGRKVVGMVPTPTGLGYYQATDAGEVIGFGDAYIAAPAAKLNQKMIGLAAAHKPAGPGGPTATTLPGTDPTDPTGPGTTPTTVAPGTDGLLTPAQKVAQSGKPNVMVIVMDDMRVEGIMDDPTVLPKTKEWLRAGGSEYLEGYATTPLCCPERATIWTGRLPHNHGVVDNHDGVVMNRDWIIPRYLRDAGYRTGLVGKFITDWHHKYEPPHFDEYAAFQGGYLDVPFMVKNPGDATSHGERTSDVADSPSDNSSDYIGHKVNQFVDAYESNDAQPWYLHVTPHAPHDDTEPPFFKWPARHNDVEVSPYDPTPAALVEGLDQPHTRAEKADKAPRIRSQRIPRAEVEVYNQGMLKTLLGADEMIDGMMQNLQAKGELENTLIIFTSDNGFSWGERGVDSKGWPYVEDVSVPFLARWDGVIPAGVTNTRPVGGEDILPTLLDAAQTTPAQIGEPFDGRSFLPTQPAKDVKFLEFGPRVGTSPSESCADEGFACYEAHRGIPTWASLRTPTYQYLEWYDTDNTTIQADNGREYYDLVTDPWQLNNLLADGNPANDPDVASLGSRLHTLRTCMGTSGATACP